MSYYLPISLLKPGEIYTEFLIDADSRLEEDEKCEIIILQNDGDEYLTVYLLEHYELTDKGKQLLLSKLDDILEKDYIPLEHYRDDDFFEKYGFHDEGIIHYEIYTNNKFTVWNDYVGQIKFKLKQ